MTQIKNTFEGGTDGVAITTGNTGGISGTAFDAIDTDTGAVQEFTSGAYEGSLALRVGTRAGSNQIVGPRWTTALGSPTDYYARYFFKITDVGTTFNRIISVRDAALEYLTQIIMDLDGQLKLYSGTGSVGVGLTAAPVPLNAWHRLEYFVHGNASAGYATLRYYADPAAAVGNFTDELNAGGATTWTMPNGITTEYVSLGVTGGGNNWPSSTGYVYFDGVVHGASNWVGPTKAPRGAVSFQNPAIA